MVGYERNETDAESGCSRWDDNFMTATVRKPLENVRFFSPERLSRVCIELQQGFKKKLQRSPLLWCGKAFCSDASVCKILRSGSCTTLEDKMIRIALMFLKLLQLFEVVLFSVTTCTLLRLSTWFWSCAHLSNVSTACSHWRIFCSSNHIQSANWEPLCVSSGCAFSCDYAYQTLLRFLARELCVRASALLY